MTEDEKKEVKKGLENYRNQLQQSMHEARGVRVELSLANLDKYRDFLQKLGELSFLIGAAIIPVILVTRSEKEVQYLPFVFAGVGIYLFNGLLAFWKSKQLLERDAGDAPHVGLNEEIHTYPIINALNKLLFDLEDKEYQAEYRQASINGIEELRRLDRPSSQKVSMWSEVLIGNFVIASLFIIRPLWTNDIWIYWLLFGLAILIMLVLGVFGYMRAWKNQVLLKNKRDDLAKIKSDYQEWHNKNILKN